MLAKELIILELGLNFIELLLEGFVATHHEVVKYVARVWDRLQHRKDARVRVHTLSQLGPG